MIFVLLCLVFAVRSSPVIVWLAENEPTVELPTALSGLTDLYSAIGGVASVRTFPIELKNTLVVLDTPAGSGPDLISVSFSGRLLDAVKNDKVSNLTDVWAAGRVAAQLPDAVIQTCLHPVTKAPMILPYLTSQMVFMYRKSLVAPVLAKLKFASFPTTLEGLLQLCAAFRAQDPPVFPIATTGANEDSNQLLFWLFDTIAARVLGADLSASFARGEIPFTDPRFRKVIDLWSSLHVKGYMGSLGGFQNNIVAFTVGLVPMYFSVSAAALGVIPLIDARVMDDIVIIPFPDVDAAIERAEYFPFRGFIVPANAKEPAEAKRFLRDVVLNPSSVFSNFPALFPVLASHTAVVTAAMPTAAVKDISRLSKEIKKLVVASFHDLETPLLRAMNATLRAATTVDEAAAFAKDAAAAQVAKLPPGSDPTTVYITYNLTFVIAQSIVAEKLGSDSVAAAMSARIDEAIGALEAARVLSIVGQVPSPITSVRPGKYPEALSVILSSPLSVPNLRIHFTTDGSTPTILSPKFSVPILIGSEGGEVLLRAIAVAPRLEPSEELSAQFIFPSKGLSVKSGLLMIGLPALGGLILVTLAAVFLIRRFVNKTKAGAWKIDPSLVTIERDKVLGSGTFGLVYAGKFRGSDVAVKEVFLHRRDYVAAMAAAGLTSLDSPGMTVTNTAMSPSSSNASLLMGPSSKVHPSGSQGRIESSPSKAAWVGQGSDDSEGTQGSRKNLISNKHSSLTSTMRGPGSTYLARTQMRGADASGYDDTKLSTKDLEGELSVLASLRHPNCLFLFGAFLNPKLSMVFVTERMEISLSDLLHTPTVQISAHRAVKLALDVARGMSYLHAHDPPILHRDLKSQNILVGSDNVAKVADFGLSELAGGRGKSIGTPPWTAPEVFENASSYAMASDVFSFGVVLWELATRRDPWWDEVSELPARQQRETIHAKVTAGARLSLGVVNKSLPKGFSGLIERCWAADPTQRPTMEECKTELAVILSACAPDDGEGGSASNQGLLKHMLTPEEVKSSLAAVKAGDPVPAIHLDTTCILFADAVGFTSFTAIVGHERSNALLAEAFGRFDPIFERHGMVQIDLLGDCVIAGAGLSSKHRLDGLTARSGDKSPFTALCPEVCRAALEMVGSTRDLMIDPDRPELGCLQWRIGIACGPLSASVVGNKNIKLQLIGDAVNTASRMESSGMAAKIQVTESVKASCAGNADLSFSFRGRIQVKGKGDMLTYFLDILQDQDRVATSPPRPAIVPSPEKAKLKK